MKKVFKLELEQEINGKNHWENYQEVKELCWLYLFFYLY